MFDLGVGVFSECMLEINKAKCRLSFGKMKRVSSGRCSYPVSAD